MTGTCPPSSKLFGRAAVPAAAGGRERRPRRETKTSETGLGVHRAWLRGIEGQGSGLYRDRVKVIECLGLALEGFERARANVQDLPRPTPHT